MPTSSPASNPLPLKSKSSLRFLYYQAWENNILFSTSSSFFPAHLAFLLPLRVEFRGISVFLKLFLAEGDVFPICFEAQLGDLTLNNHLTQVSIG